MYSSLNLCLIMYSMLYDEMIYDKNKKTLKTVAVLLKRASSLVKFVMQCSTVLKEDFNHSTM